MTTTITETELIRMLTDYEHQMQTYIQVNSRRIDELEHHLESLHLKATGTPQMQLPPHDPTQDETGAGNASELASSMRSDWTYNAMPVKTTCSIAKDQLDIAVVFSKRFLPGEQYPDVILLEENLRFMEDVEWTVESFCEQLKKVYPDMTITCEGWATSHGIIKVVM